MPGGGALSTSPRPPRFETLAALDRDGRILFSTRMLRLFAYGMLSVVLVLYLLEVGLDDDTAGWLLTLTLLGDTAVSLALASRADAFGRRRTLEVGALLMAGAGLAFLGCRAPGLLLVAATIGIISPSGNEVGPFLAIEQAALTGIVPAARRTAVLAWYTLGGSVATATGSLAAGTLVHLLLGAGATRLEAYRAVILLYALAGLLLAAAFRGLSDRVEVPPQAGAARPEGSPLLGLSRSRRVVLHLSGLFALDAFAGGFIVQSVVAWWFTRRFGVEEVALGGIFFGANLLSGLSALLAARLAARFGLVNTMVFTHLPSNLLLMCVPLAPTAGGATLLLLARHCISQMDVPTRQSYVMAVVDPGERSAAAAVTGVARTLGASLSPALAARCMASPALIGLPFFLAGGLKIAYDLLLYRGFVSSPAPEEQKT